MADKSGKPSSNVFSKPVPMKLFAAWEVDRTPPSCIPRLCTLTLNRLVLLKPLGSDVTSLTVAVKMQSSKRTLRSNDIQIPNSGLLDTELDLSFSLQYPHFLKRSGNQLQVILQRRKRYKNRAMLGFKTIAGGIINMGEVLQKPVDKELDLLSDVKEKSEVIGRITMIALSTQPVDHDDSERQKHTLGTDVERSADYSDDDDESTSNEEGSDSEAVIEDGAGHPNGHLRRRRSSQMRKRNIKQKFIALLKKFRVPDAEAYDTEQYPEDLEQELMNKNPREIEDLLFDELEDLSDSGPEADDISISSTPKPSLRPFFSSSTLVTMDNEKVIAEKQSDDSLKRESDSNQDTGTEQEYGEGQIFTSSPPSNATSEEKKSLAEREKEKDKEKKSKLFARERHTSTSKDKRTSSQKESKEKAAVEKTSSIRETEISPRKSVIDQLSRIFASDDTIPDHVFLVHAVENAGNVVSSALQERQQCVVTAGTSPDLKASVSTLVNKIQKFCNCNSRAPATIRVAIVGLDHFVNSVLRLYVENFSSKPPEWQTYVKFYIIPLGSSPIAKYLASVDNCYSANFMDSSWKDLLEHSTDNSAEMQEVVSRVLNYVGSASAVIHLPVAEVMVTYKEKSSDEESSQVFIPFVSEVKIGVMEGTSSSVDLDDTASTVNTLSGSPPTTSHMEKAKENTTPPSSPSISNAVLNSGPPNSASILPTGETMDLQLDYWTVSSKGEQSKKADSNKFSLKTTFRTLQVSRLPNLGEPSSSSLTLSYITKEKKQKIMRLGKKKERERDTDSRCQVAEGVHRLICSCKSPQAPLKVTVDGVEWSGVKFFQLSSQWQTHIKYFPVALYSIPEHGSGH